MRKANILDNAVLKSEVIPFFVKEGSELVTKLKPMVWIQNLKEHIMYTLDELER